MEEDQFGATTIELCLNVVSVHGPSYSKHKYEFSVLNLAFCKLLLLNAFVNEPNVFMQME